MSNATVTCSQFGHSWVIRPKGGMLVELCSACGARPEDVLK
jgi:hypothetical protein